MPTSLSPVTQLWPLFGLSVRTPRLTLRYVDDDLGAALMQLAAADGVHDPGEMPFTLPWTRSPSPLLEREGLQRYWRGRAQTSPHAWSLSFAVLEDDVLVGEQNLRATDFGTRRTVGSASWVARSRQGRGIGREMRAAALHLAFDGLEAQVATSGAFEDNPASLAVSRSPSRTAKGSVHASGEVFARPRQKLWSPSRSSCGDGVRVQGTVKGISAGSCTPSAAARAIRAPPRSSST